MMFLWWIVYIMRVVSEKKIEREERELSREIWTMKFSGKTFICVLYLTLSRNMIYRSAKVSINKIIGAGNTGAVRVKSRGKIVRRVFQTEERLLDHSSNPYNKSKQYSIFWRQTIFFCVLPCDAKSKRIWNCHFMQIVKRLLKLK